MIILCYEVGGQEAPTGVYRSPRESPTSTAIFLSLHAAGQLPSTHEFIQKHQRCSSSPQAGDSLSMSMRSQPCSCLLGLIFMAVGRVGGGLGLSSSPGCPCHGPITPYPSPPSSSSSSDPAIRGVGQVWEGAENDLAGSQSLTTFPF